MGRKKISIQRIEDPRLRNITFNKRKCGLLKKAVELSVLCGLRLLLVFEDTSGNIHKYESQPWDELVSFFEEAEQSKKCYSFAEEDYPTFSTTSKKKSNKELEKAKQNLKGSSALRKHNTRLYTKSIKSREQNTNNINDINLGNQKEFDDNLNTNTDNNSHRGFSLHDPEYDTLFADDLALVREPERPYSEGNQRRSTSIHCPPPDLLEIPPRKQFKLDVSDNDGDDCTEDVDPLLKNTQDKVEELTNDMRFGQPGQSPALGSATKEGLLSEINHTTTYDTMRGTTLPQGQFQPLTLSSPSFFLFTPKQPFSCNNNNRYNNMFFSMPGDLQNEERGQFPQMNSSFLLEGMEEC